MNTTHLFVDEAGDTTLFGKHGKVLVGTAVTSRFFLVGRLEVADLQALASGLALHLLAMWPCFTQVLDLDVPVAQPRRKGPTHQATEFNEKHPLNLASRAGV